MGGPHKKRTTITDLKIGVVLALIMMCLTQTISPIIHLEDDPTVKTDEQKLSE